jgi:hypothetical protein
MPEDVIYLTEDFEPVSEDDPRMAMVKVRLPDGKIVFGFPEAKKGQQGELFVQGGQGSGHHGHRGRPGMVGGSKKVFHGTSLSNVKSIMEKGLLTSKDKEKWRGFVFVTDAIDQAKIFGMGDRERGKYAVLHIDTAKLPQGIKIEGFGGRLTTTSDIPPEAIVKVEIFKFGNQEDAVSSHVLVETIKRNASGKIIYLSVPIEEEPNG